MGRFRFKILLIVIVGKESNLGGQYTVAMMIGPNEVLILTAST